jgi:hypothetical protein
MRKKKKNIKAPLRFEVVSLFPGCFEKKKGKRTFIRNPFFRERATAPTLLPRALIPVPR